MEITPLCSMMGARIEGVDLAAARDNATTDAIQQALVDYGFIVFPDQHITPEEHIAFGAQFGPLNVHPHMESLEGHPEILNIKKEPEETANFGGGWHTDHVECNRRRHRWQPVILTAITRSIAEIR